MLQKKWILKQADEETVQGLQRELGINKTVCRLLVQRGIHTYNEAKHFFRPSLNALHDPWLLKDMSQAIERLTQAMHTGERILVFGDYDVDGTTAVSLVYRLLKNIYPAEKLDFYIPHRYKESYGISQAGIDYAVANNFSLIIALDCGIKSIELVDYANQRNVDFIICDHHLPGNELPKAVAIINPKQPEC